MAAGMKSEMAPPDLLRRRTACRDYGRAVGAGGRGTDAVAHGLL